jgi:lysophospholipase L1-like esterase
MIGKRPRRRAWYAAIVLVVTVTACSSSKPSASAPTTDAPSSTSTTPPSTALAPPLVTNLAEVKTLTALGDSVPYGTACNCTPYPQLTSNEIATVVGHHIDTVNDSVPGTQSKDVLGQLEHDTSIIDHVKHSEAVTVEVGANDVSYSSTCGTDVACYEQKMPALANNLDAIVARIHQLTSGHDVTIILLDYWSVWLGGKYAEERGPAYVDAAKDVTRSVSDTIISTATSTSSVYVDLRRAFRGPDNAWDETHLLAPDGDHPNAAGHMRITQAIVATLAADV